MRIEFYKANLDSVSEVYAETESGGETAGYTSNYIKVYSGEPICEIKKLILKYLYKEGVKAENYEE